MAEKARATRLGRLQAMVGERLDQPAAALEVLMSELGIGERQPRMWEALHAAAVRDGKETELAGAYQKIASARRLKQIEPSSHADVLVHAADFSQGILGDRDSAAEFLWRVLELVPDHEEAFSRLKQRFEGNRLKTLELYAAVAKSPPKQAADVARSALNGVKLLPSATPLGDDACKQLVVLTPSSPALLDALDAHCRKTDRAKLACDLREAAIEAGGLRDAVIDDQRRRLVELYLGDAKDAERAIAHVEELLRRDPMDAKARGGADQLLSDRAVGSRAAAALQVARRLSRAPPR